MSKLYGVYEEQKIFNDFGDEQVRYIELGYTHAISEEEAIKNVKHRKKIRKKNFYTSYDYYANNRIEHSFKAKLIKEEKENGDL